MSFGKKHICIIAAASVLAGSGALLCACGNATDGNIFTVMLPDGVGYSLNGDAVRQVRAGDSVVFDVSIDDGYKFVNASVGKYEDGKLVLENVKYSVTVDLVARLSTDIADIVNGTVTVSSPVGGGLCYGQPAEFEFVPNDNYVIEELYIGGKPIDFDRAADGSVTVTQVYDEFVSLYAVCYGKECTITDGETDGGTVTVTVENETVRYGDTVKVSCAPDSEYKTAYIEIGGEYIYGTEQYEFTVLGDTFVTARFVGEDSAAIVYDYNGAEVSHSAMIVDYAADGEFVYLQNGYGVWTRDGYTLESWNTESDGSGERHALGAMIVMPDRDALGADKEFKLYAQYKKHTPSEFFKFEDCAAHDGSDGYRIVSYSDGGNNLSEVVIPDSYNGKKVVAIGDGAFDGNAHIKSIVTTAALEKIGARALGNMSALTELYLFDSIRSFSDTALVGTDLNKLHMNSATKRIYDKILESNMVDKQMLVKTSNRQKIVTYSGCSIAKGMCSEMFYDNEMLKDYDVIHMGVHARFGSGMFLKMTENYLNAGDIVVLAFENYDHLWLTDEGMELVNAEQPWRLRHFESNYDIYEEYELADTKDINDILSALPVYVAARASDLDSGRVYNTWPRRDMMNEHGDYTYFRANAEEGSLVEDVETLYPSMNFLNGVDRMNAWARPLIERGVRVCFIFPPVYRYKAYDDEVNATLRREFLSELNARLEFPVLGSIDDAAMPYYCFNDWINHPSTDGTKEYTARFIRLLSAAVADGTV